MPSARWVYAIIGRDTPLPASGVARAAGLAPVRWRELAAVTAPTGEAGPPLSMQAVVHHEAVVEAVRQQGPALPVRFGTIFRDAASVASALEERYDALVADLRRLGDKVELSLTALWAAPPSDDAPLSAHGDDGTPAARGAGARYLRARAVELRRADALRERARSVARALDDALGGLALERRTSLVPTTRVAVRAAYLLHPAGAADFRAAFEEVRAARGDLRLLLTGPWPPYGFVARADGDGDGAPEGRLAALVRLLDDGSGAAADQPRARG